MPQGEYGYENFRVIDAVIIDGDIWLFGAQYGSSRFCNRIYRSSDAMNWHLVSQNLPYPCEYYAAAAWNDRIWVFGGGSPYDYFPDVNIWYTEETPAEVHRADYDADGALSLSELLRVVQLYQADKYQCDGRTEDSYAPGEGYETCVAHSSDYHPQDWSIDLSELLRLIQLFNLGGAYHYCPDSATEDGFCPGEAGDAM